MNNKTTYYKKIRKKLLNRAKEYYENNIERFWEQAKNKYRELSKEEKDKEREYGRNRYQNRKQTKSKIILKKLVNREAKKLT